jgi:hypothetical protein
MTYPFVAARWFTPGAITGYRALIVHMAEGGGTASYFTKVDRDVSASHVIEYSGRIVQMVKDGDASHCQHTSFEPYTSAAYGIYASSIGRAVLGSDGWADVNRYVFAVEIEGFRATGPNDAQKAALVALVADLRARFPSIRGLLGHRDVQDKSCPGALIPWASIGGHGYLEVEVIDEVKGEDWKPAGGTRKPYRSRPERVNDAIAGYLEADKIVRTIAELHANGQEWRLSEIGGNPTYFLRLDLDPLIQGGDPATDAALVDYIARKPVTDCAPLVNAARQEGVTAGLRDGARAVKDAAVNAAVLLGG